ncbi:hypothetical protein [Streptomyces graminilatus]|uniref:hypothetical protein n=1 Tax=Streptomyces graminilatus TaxID=1464070 RepID=UPI001F522EA8|nr:hypothetical protein [Streptomyces graminilatus]
MNALAARLSGTRARAIEELTDAVAAWGADVPDDPGLTELADLLAEVAGRFPDDLDGHEAATAHLREAVERLRAVGRLGSLLPAVACAHLRRALQQEQRARLALNQTVLPAT